MKILFISDIHGNIENIKKISLDYDKIIVLGDLFGHSYEDNIFVVNFLKKLKEKLILIKGNCDSEEVLNDLGLIFYNYYDLNIDNLVIRCLHGNNLYLEDNIDVLIFGHKHYPYVEKDESLMKICVGALNFPRNGSRPSYCVYENRCFTLYDIDAKIIDEIKL